MNWKKPILTLGLTAILLLFLSACGGEPAPAANSPVENQPASPANLPAEEEPAAPEKPTPEPAPTEEPQPEEPAEPAAQVSYSTDVQPILESRCLSCHGGERIEGAFVIGNYIDLLAGGESGPVVIPGDADNSYLAELILSQKMPKRGPKLTPAQTELIITWINQGATNN